MTFTLAAQNVLYKLDRGQTLHDLRLGNVASVRGMQEANGRDARAAIAQNAGETDRAVFSEPDVPLIMDWDRAEFTGQPFRGIRMLHEAMPGHETETGFHARYLQYVHLVREPTGKDVLAVNLHATNGVLQPDADSPWDDAHDAWKDWAFQQYWLGVVAFVARQMKQEAYDAIFVLGDFNAPLVNREKWYYPGPMTDGLLTQDPDAPRSIDHICASLDSEVVLTNRRFVTEVNSDHPISLMDAELVDAGSSSAGAAGAMLGAERRQ